MPTAEVLRTEHETREGESGKEMGKIRILADSTCDLTPQMLQQYGVQIVPLNIVLNDKAYQDGVEIGPDEIYAWSEAHKTTPKTSAMTLGRHRKHSVPVVSRVMISSASVSRSRCPRRHRSCAWRLRICRIGGSM